jgi:hypothetical protein
LLLYHLSCWYSTVHCAAHFADPLAPNRHAIRRQSFGIGALPGLQSNPSVQQLEERYAAAIRREVAEKLREALAAKEQVPGREPGGRAARLRRQLPRATTPRPL